MILYEDKYFEQLVLHCLSIGSSPCLYAHSTHQLQLLCVQYQATYFYHAACLHTTMTSDTRPMAAYSSSSSFTLFRRI